MQESYTEDKRSKIASNTGHLEETMQDTAQQMTISEVTKASK
jgi:hypothetical protein